jgi:hypothetical protein
MVDGELQPAKSATLMICELYKRFGWRFHMLTFTGALFPVIEAPGWVKFAGAQGKQNVSIFRPRRPGGAVHDGHKRQGQQ